MTNLAHKNQSEKSSHDEIGKYMAFTSVLKSELLEDREKSNASHERSEDDRNIYNYKAFDKLFQDCLKLKNVNSAIFKKLHKIELEKESHI